MSAAPPAGAVFETVPNVSTADVDVVAAVARTLARPGARLVHVTSDASHGRSVLTAIGDVAALADGLVDAARTLAASCDLRRHVGVHPRVGLLDVAPLIALRPEAGPEAARPAARALGARLAREARVAAVAYDAADDAGRPLPDLRRGGLQGLLARIDSGEVPAWLPDGDLDDAERRRVGVTCVGARGILVAFNVDLATDDVARVRAWAKALRETGGGLPRVRALGFPLAPGRCQVAMNLLDYRRTGPLQAFEAVEALAREDGVDVLRSELIGCVPRAAWPPGTAERLREPDMAADRADLRILETWLPGGSLADHPGLDPATFTLRA